MKSIEEFRDRRKSEGITGHYDADKAYRNYCIRHYAGLNMASSLGVVLSGEKQASAVSDLAGGDHLVMPYIADMSVQSAVCLVDALEAREAQP